MTPRLDQMSAETLRLYADCMFACHYFNLSERSRKAAWDAATLSPAEAGACYRAIAASLREAT